MKREQAIRMLMVEFECDEHKANHILNFCQFDICMSPPENKEELEDPILTYTIMEWDD